MHIGLTDTEMLRHVANELGDDWRRLAQLLNIRRVRLQAILRNNINSSIQQTTFEMLLSWVKKLPRAANKVLYCSRNVAMFVM